MTAMPALVDVTNDRPSLRVLQWAALAADAPVLAGTMGRYLDQIAVSLRPATVASAEVILRRFAGSSRPTIPKSSVWLTFNAAISKRSNATAPRCPARTVSRRYQTRRSG
jgi:hypothetical protein